MHFAIGPYMSRKNESQEQIADLDLKEEKVRTSIFLSNVRMKTKQNIIIA